MLAKEDRDMTGRPRGGTSIQRGNGKNGSLNVAERKSMVSGVRAGRNKKIIFENNSGHDA